MLAALKRVSNDRRTRKLLARPRVELLEQRLVLDGPSGALARFTGELTEPGERDTIELNLDPADFILSGGRVLLGFAVQPADGSSLDPARVELASEESRAHRRVRRSDSEGGPASFTLGDLGTG